MLHRFVLLGRGCSPMPALACVVTLVVAGCGVRGRPEPPTPAPARTVQPAARAAAAQPQRQAVVPVDDEENADSTALISRPNSLVENEPGEDDAVADAVSPQPTPPSPRRRKAKSPYVVPKEPFFLDPIL